MFDKTKHKLKRHLIVLLITSLLTILIIIQAPAVVKASMIEPLSLGESYITEDGFIYSSTRYKNAISIVISTLHRGYVEWNISSLPDNSTISEVQFDFEGNETGDSGFKIYQMELQPSITPNADVYNDVANGTLYALTSTVQDGVIQRVNLGKDAAQDLENNLNEDWFAIGLYDDDGGDSTIVSEEDTDDKAPTIIVHYAYTAFNYTFYGVFYGNGTYQGPANITGHDSDGSYKFNLTHHEGYTVSFDQRPIMFSFTYGTNTRRLYVLEDSETFYVLTPDDDYASYEFTILDYTGQIDPGNSYFEAYRSVNGTERLAERMIIQDLFNTVPISAVLERTYHIKIEYGATLDWGYWIAGIDPTPTVVLRDVSFSQQAQITYRHVTVEATRPQDTQITVDYRDTLDQTTWANLTITYRNGTSVHTESNNASEKTFNWLGADGETDYVVRLDIDHELYGTALKYVEYLDAEGSYIQTPDIEAFGSFAGMDVDNLIAISITILLFTGFTYQFGSDAGVIAGLGTITSLTALGLADYTYNFMAFLWFLGIIGILVGRLR